MPVLAVAGAGDDAVDDVVGGARGAVGGWEMPWPRRADPALGSAGASRQVVEEAGADSRSWHRDPGAKEPIATLAAPCALQKEPPLLGAATSENPSLPPMATFLVST